VIYKSAKILRSWRKLSDGKIRGQNVAQNQLFSFIMAWSGSHGVNRQNKSKTDQLIAMGTTQKS
jgi:hypothetical protein